MRSDDAGSESIRHANQEPKMTGRERMAALRQKAMAQEPAQETRSRWKREEEELDRFMEDEVAPFAFGAPGMPGRDIADILKDVGLNEPSFRLVPKPKDAWDLVRSYRYALAEPTDLCERVFEPWAAFDAGCVFGMELARHEAEQPVEQAAPTGCKGEAQR
jgi:hypothetical protein